MSEVPLHSLGSVSYERGTPAFARQRTLTSESAKQGGECNYLFRLTHPEEGCAPLRPTQREFIDYKTSMITDEDPLRRLLFYEDLGFFHTQHVHKTLNPEL
jgi:hypothetical protein